MSTEVDRRHPDLIAALAAFDEGRPGPLLAIAARSIRGVDQGRYCECADPLVLDTDLMCGACLLRNREAEVRAVLRIVTAHEFVPDDRGRPLCAVCTQFEDHERHRGVHGTGRTSWGSTVVVGP